VFDSLEDRRQETGNKGDKGDKGENKFIPSAFCLLPSAFPSLLTPKLVLGSRFWHFLRAGAVGEADGVVFSINTSLMGWS
jgi:hypothetical protein